MSGRLDTRAERERAALAGDPTLVFRRLPPLELSAAEEAAEVESVRRAVAAMRAGRRLARCARAGRHWHRYAAAAVLAVAALSLGVDRAPNGADPSGLGATAAPGLAHRPSRLFGAIVPAHALAPAAPVPDVSYGEADGAMEGLNRPQARVYQLHGRHLQVVMIVDERLDV